MRTHLLPLLLYLLLGLPVNAAELKIELGDHTRIWSTAELLGLPQAQLIEIPADVGYRRPMRYRAVPLRTLLPGVGADQHVQAVAMDGFVAELPAAPLLQEEGSVAWLAIEEPGTPWPGLAAGKAGAGPFYLVWENPAASAIGPEQWPFQLAALRTTASVSQRFPALVPAADAPDDVQQGFVQFQKHCLACHRLNGEGASEFGPDLNIPYSPTEYLAGDFLLQYIRDPQNLRRWPQARMPGFDSATLGDLQLHQLLTYLRHMAGRKQGTSASP
ncbi:c-type cytochrome [Pseudomonas sp. N040]|uniref:c-type cytochrome n=1 Tax=Pseudomonas sp. N040 TaxID=2785325 RepID=UPI0018A2E63F|nr:cytochrome c [Pseudomonas sp. N040]MBF7731421.1 c-type cytochrome [Pseudomonas sp. N040]MBW7015065.1 cytochrome c [Pseudomonas sp. N040]